MAITSYIDIFDYLIPEDAACDLLKDLNPNDAQEIIGHLHRFEEDIFWRIYLDGFIESMLLSYPIISLIYSKGFIEEAESERKLARELYKRRCELINRDIVSLNDKDFDTDKVLSLILRIRLINLLSCCSDDEFVDDMAKIDVSLSIKAVPEVRRIICRGTMEDFCKLVTSLKIIKGRNLYGGTIKDFFPSPEEFTSSLCDYHERSEFEILSSIGVGCLNYAYTDWEIQHNPNDYATFERDRRCGTIESSGLSLETWNRYDEYFSAKNNETLLKSFFRYVLAKELNDRDLNVILSFFAKNRISSYVKEEYKRFRESHPSQKEIIFYDDVPFRNFATLPALDIWDEAALKRLWELLKKPCKKLPNSMSFIDNKTKAEDFIFVFSRGEIHEGFTPIRWTGSYKNNGHKQQILDLLILMGYSFEELKTAKGLKKNLEYCFCEEFKPNNFSRGHESTYHDVLESIVKRALTNR